MKNKLKVLSLLGFMSILFSCHQNNSTLENNKKVLSNSFNNDVLVTNTSGNNLLSTNIQSINETQNVSKKSDLQLHHDKNSNVSQIELGAIHSTKIHSGALDIIKKTQN